MTDTPLIDFTHDTQLSQIPHDVQAMGRICLLDLLGVAIAGRQTKTAQIIIDHALATMPASAECKARILFDGRLASPQGAALAGGMIIDAMDAHDGHRMTKGHAGCGVLPALLAQMDDVGCHDDDRLLESLIIGYEIAIRAGIALHQSVADYHTSGAWVALAAAAIGARLHKMDHITTQHAIGIAEYHGPRSQMMRVIDHSTMLKDGSGWGAMAGVSAADLARRGFTGAPAITTTADDLAYLWQDLGQRWYILELYFKLWPVCRWAQPAMQAIIDLHKAHQFAPNDVKTITIKTFHAAIRLAEPHPQDDTEAQYSICWPVAAMLYACHENRVFSPDDVSDKALKRQDIHELADRIILEEHSEIEAVFPAQRQAIVSIHLHDGKTISSGTTIAAGDPETPLTHADFLNKFRLYAQPLNDSSRIEKMINAIFDPNPEKSDGITNVIY